MPSNGTVEAIYITEKKKGTMLSVPSAQAVAGHGLTGDRYWDGGGKPSPDTEITLIEAEAIEAVSRAEGIPFDSSESRRNLVTRGVALNHLVDRRFRVGKLTLRGIRLCEPCVHLENMTRPGVRLALLHRGGLRAQIVEGGEVHVGDAVTD